LITRRKLLTRAALVGICAPSIIIPKFSEAQIVQFSGAPIGYNNLTNIPSAANRPVFNSGTGVLSWIGPVGGGPSTASDMAQTRTLSASGSITVSSNNQVISGLNISGNITLNGKTGGTISQCYIQWQSGLEQIVATLAATGWTIEDCEIDGAGNGTSGQGGFEGIGLVPTNMTIRRCNFHGMENGISQSANGCTIIDCWFHALAGPDCDGIEFNNNVTSGTVQHSSFDWTGSLGFTNSGVNITNVSGGVTGVSIDTCYFLNYPAFAICVGDSISSGEAFGCVNSGFFNNFRYRRIDAGVVASPNSGNFNMASASSTSGTPTNGTGSI